jgi:hypothetical protein
MSAIEKALLNDRLDRLKRRLEKINESTRHVLKIDDLTWEVAQLRDAVLDLGKLVLAIYEKKEV